MSRAADVVVRGTQERLSHTEDRGELVASNALEAEVLDHVPHDLAGARRAEESTPPGKVDAAATSILTAWDVAPTAEMLALRHPDDSE